MDIYFTLIETTSIISIINTVRSVTKFYSGSPEGRTESFESQRQPVA